jgi:AcrR family transcriptional regulator
MNTHVHDTLRRDEQRCQTANEHTCTVSFVDPDEGRVDPRAERSRRRIAQAVYELHKTIGPAQTTVSAIASKAGVQRLTVYRHFPDELDLHRACLAHWSELHPWPDPSPWRAIADPRERLRTALREIYRFFAEVEPLFLLGSADMPRLPKLQEADAPLFEHWEQMRRVLLKGWRVRGHRRRRLATAIGVAIDFQIWYTLTRRGGASDEDAVELAVCQAECATRATRARPGRTA